MNDIVVAIITSLGAFAIAYLTGLFQKRKMDAEINLIYSRLGLDKAKMKAETADTWMAAAQKAADEYERVLLENGSLKRKIGRQNKRIEGLEKRIRILEAKKRKR